MSEKNQQDIKSGDIDEYALKKKIGHRFKCFREAIGKSQLQLASELNTSQDEISMLENGNKLPLLLIIKSSNKLYGLDLNWLLTGTNKMFLRDRNDKPGKYDELMLLMGVPRVKEGILYKLDVAKTIFKEEIKELRRNNERNNERA